ncbi:hypothetical protein KM043_005211 [Ampulex compressa]|nr:hypothetical protein KM043_005211 [Ampulex compressa]
MSSPSVSGYSLLEKIGSGSFATVYKATKKDGCRDLVAIKCIDRSKLSSIHGNNYIVTEICLLKVLKHENIVEMREFFWDPGYIYIVMEYCNGGDLSTFIKKRQKLPERICRRFLQQLALALKYLRSHNVSHMDLKPKNLLLIKKPQLVLKVADFGLAQYLSNSERKFTIRGSPLYMAPEILLKGQYDARVDLWSVGVIMYECLFGKAPYSSGSYEELLKKIKDGCPIEIPNVPPVSANCSHLLRALLKRDPMERITFDEFFAHDFLDLDYAPTEENYKKATELAQKAMALDVEKKEKEAFHVYCEALRYFIPFLMNETDTKHKEHLRLKVNKCIKRAEELKAVSTEDSNGEKTCAREEEKANTSSLRNIPIGQRPIPAYRELRILCKSTPSMADGIEIGDIAEQYLAEGNYALALEKFQSCLGVLVPLLRKEPPGQRRSLLHEQVTFWMKEAESSKALLESKDIEDSALYTTESRDQCRMQ